MARMDLPNRESVCKYMKCFIKMKKRQPFEDTIPFNKLYYGQLSPKVEHTFKEQYVRHSHLTLIDDRKYFSDRIRIHLFFTGFKTSYDFLLGFQRELTSFNCKVNQRDKRTRKFDPKQIDACSKRDPLLAEIDRATGKHFDEKY